MFKTINLYRINNLPASQSIEDGLAANKFYPCGLTQQISVGWLPPRGIEHGAMVEAIGGHLIMKLCIETKSVPGDLVRRKAQAEADQIEANTGRKPGKKEMKSLREDALLALLPAAFPKRRHVWVWIDPVARTLVHDASSQGVADEVVTAIVRAIDKLALSPVVTTKSPGVCMAAWLTDPDTLHEDLVLDRECELKSSDEDKATVKFARHHLVTDEVRKHISEGKLPTRLALSYDGRVSFVLTDRMHLKKVRLLDTALEGRADDTDAFDADVALVTGEFAPLITALVKALGGESNDLFGGE